VSYKKFVFKSDDEEAVKALKNKSKNDLQEEVVVEGSAVGDHAGNGAIEHAVKQVQGLKSVVEARYKGKVKGDHDSIPWLVSHAAATINRRRRDNSGMTAYRRWKGREFNRFVCEFGKNVM
jgi:hypothetical protein